VGDRTWLFEGAIGPLVLSKSEFVKWSAICEITQKEFRCDPLGSEESHDTSLLSHISLVRE
jgi:hypothetical protein